MIKSELHNSKETKEILEKGSPDVFFRWYYKKKKGPTHHPGDNIVKKSRIDKLEGRMDRFEERMDQFEGRMDRFEERMGQFEGRFDRIEESIANLARIVEDGFKQVNNRIDNLEKDVNSLKQDVKDINTRLDYIVQANNLKDNKRSKRLT